MNINTVLIIIFITILCSLIFLGYYKVGYTSVKNRCQETTLVTKTGIPVYDCEGYDGL